MLSSFMVLMGQEQVKQAVNMCCKKLSGTDKSYLQRQLLHCLLGHFIKTQIKANAALSGTVRRAI